MTPVESSTIAATLAAAQRTLAAGSDTPRLDAEILLRHLLGLDRAALFTRLMDSITDDDRRAFAELVTRRLAGAPVAYLTGEREFMGLPFIVRPDVLVPRPETEGLVEWTLDRLSWRPVETILDVGTGCGAIALAVAARQSPTWRGRIVASDLSPAALAVAAENRVRLGQSQRVFLVRGDLADWCAAPVDLVLANLPYLRPDQVAANPALAAEPEIALLGGRDGLDLIRRLIADAPRLLAAGGALALEIDPSQVEPIAAAIATALPTAAIAVRPDLSGRPRFVIAEIGS